MVVFTCFFSVKYLSHACLGTTTLTQMMADEFDFLWLEIQNYIAEADADAISVPGQLESHGRCRYGVLCLQALVLSVCRRSSCGYGGIGIRVQMQMVHM